MNATDNHNHNHNNNNNNSNSVIGLKLLAGPRKNLVYSIMQTNVNRIKNTEQS